MIIFTNVCYLINERSLIRFLCVGKDPRIKSEDDIYLSLRGVKRRGNLESGLPRYARSDGKEGYELVAWFDRVWTYGFAYGE